MKLYNFFRSSTSHRLRIAFGLKGVAYDYVAVDLPSDEHLSAAYAVVNPQKLVPTLVDQGEALVQSPAIIEWLEERYPTPPLLPKGPRDRARARALAAVVGCDIHPLNNRRVLQHLRRAFGADEAAIQAWCASWIETGFDALEAMLRADPARGRFSFGDAPTLADVYLIPQVESARRFKIDVGRWPIIAAIDSACGEIEAFRSAGPSWQPDSR
jgi:maleylpyruvate isomerase